MEKETKKTTFMVYGVGMRFTGPFLKKIATRCRLIYMLYINILSFTDDPKISAQRLMTMTLSSQNAID